MASTRRWLLGVLLLAATAQAQAAPTLLPAAGAALTVDAPVAEPSGVNVSAVGLRLVAIRNAATVEASRMQLWRWSWVAVYVALTVGNLVPIPFVAPADRVDMVVGAASSAFGALLEIIFPPDIIGNARRYAEFPATPEGLAEAEKLLRHDADNEEFGRSWMFHVGNVVFNAAIGLLLGLGWKHWEGAAIGFGIGVVVGEVMIFSQPHMLADVSRAGGAPTVTMAPFFLSGGGGLALVGRF